MESELPKPIKLSELTSPQLASIHNYLTGSNLIKFRDLAAGVKRTQRALDHHKLMVVYTIDASRDQIDVVPVSTSPEIALISGDLPRIMRGETYPLDAEIVVLIEGNPKRPGSQSAARFAQYRSGMTVSDYITACAGRYMQHPVWRLKRCRKGDAVKLAHRHGHADLHWDTKRGYIAVTLP